MLLDCGMLRVNVMRLLQIMAPTLYLEFIYYAPPRLTFSQVCLLKAKRMSYLVLSTVLSLKSLQVVSQLCYKTAAIYWFDLPLVHKTPREMQCNIAKEWSYRLRSSVCGGPVVSLLTSHNFKTMVSIPELC